MKTPTINPSTQADTLRPTWSTQGALSRPRLQLRACPGRGEQRSEISGGSMIRKEKSKGILFKCPQHNRRGEQRIISIAMKHETQTGRGAEWGGGHSGKMKLVLWGVKGCHWSLVSMSCQGCERKTRP